MRRALTLLLTSALLGTAISVVPASPAAAASPLTLTTGFYVDPNSSPATWARNNPSDARAARIQASIGSKSMSRWFGNWNTNISADVSAYVAAADAVDKLPILTAYNIPGRDACGGQSGGGAGTPAAYQTWIAAFATAIGTRPAVVIIEPDGLGDFNCMTTAQITSRNSMLVYATNQFKTKAVNTWAYLDGGNVNWNPAATMATRLHNAGVANVRGFSLNVSNYYTTAQTTPYGDAINSGLATHGYTRTYAIDTSRNGNGSNGVWCNPSGRKLGTPTQTGGGAEMLLWVKTAGNSDGLCGAAPTTPAGTFSPDLAIHLIDGF
jgi:endoglucanase